jgi:glycosyltransferase involved in cell wall biosynthesis
MANKVISMIIPCFNEERNVDTLYNELKIVFSHLNYQYELVFINDGSTDKTLSILTKIANKDRRVLVLDFSRNFGKDIALSAGLDYCTGNAAIPIDADLQHPTNIIPDFIKKWENGYEVVLATRTRRNGDSLMRKLTAFLFYRIISILTDVKIPKDTGDFRLIDRKVIDALKLIKEKHRFMKGIFSWVGYKSTVIYYENVPRKAGKTKWNFFKLFTFAIDGITSFSNYPLRISTILGFIISISTFIYACYIILLKLHNDINIEGYATNIVLILFLGGIQLISLGIIGEYVGKVYDEVKNRPLYIIKKVIKS